MILCYRWINMKEHQRTLRRSGRERRAGGGAVNCSSTSSESVCLSWWCKSSNFISLVTHMILLFLWITLGLRMFMLFMSWISKRRTHKSAHRCAAVARRLHFSSSARPDLLGDLILPTVTRLLDCVRALIRGILSLVLRPEPRVFLHLLFLRVSWLFTLCVIAATATC